MGLAPFLIKSIAKLHTMLRIIIIILINAKIAEMNLPLKFVKKIFQKPLDKFKQMCYNINVRKRESPSRVKGKVLIMMNFMTWLTNIERMTAETYESLPALYQDKIRLNYQSFREGYGYAA